MAIRPDAEGGEHHALLFAFHWALAPTGILLKLPTGHGQLEPQPINQHDRWWRRQPRRFEGMRPLFKAQHQAITGGE